jgi:hypothetical protein
MATKKTSFYVSFTENAAGNAMRRAIPEVLVGMGYKAAGGGTNDALKNSDYDMHIDLNVKVYMATRSTVVSYTLPGDMIKFMKHITPATPKKVSVEKQREIRQTPGYQPAPCAKRDSPMFKVGDEVVVTNTGNQYSSYTEMYKLMGFKNQKENSSYGQSFVKERIATIFDMHYHINPTNPAVLCGIRFDDGFELLIDQAGLRKFDGFIIGDHVVVMPKDPNYGNVYDADKGKAVRVIKGTYTAYGTKKWVEVRFSNDASNSYNIVRYATEAEIEAMPKPKASFSIGDTETSKTVEVSQKGIYVSGSHRLEFDHLKEVVTAMRSFKPELHSRYWAMSIPTISIGCTKNVTYKQLKAILDHAVKIGLGK